MNDIQDITITKQEAISLGIIDGLGYVLSEKSVFKNVNEKLLAALQKGNLIYRKPWRDGYKIKGVTYGAHNYVTASPYKGANAFMININNFLNNTNYQQFLTLKQIKERGGKLKKGAEPFPVWAFIKSTKIIVDKKTNKESSMLMKGVIYYTVYPIDHTEDVKPIKRKENQVSAEQYILEADTLVAKMPKVPAIKHGGDRAFYSPSLDFVQMPFKNSFHHINEYYSTLFHELAHSTGNKKRIGRDFGGKMGDKKYAFEELVAELSAAYLCGVCELDYYTLDNSAAYLKSWSNSLQKEIKDNPNFLLRAVYAATKAAKYIIGETLVKNGFISGDVDKSIQGNANTFARKLKKGIKNLFPSLKGTEDFGLTFIHQFIEFNGKEITKNDIALFINRLALAIQKKQVTKAHPYKDVINGISAKLYKLHKVLKEDEIVKVEIVNIKFYKSILEKELSGLGFLPVVMAAAVGRGVEHLIHEGLKKKAVK